MMVKTLKPDFLFYVHVLEKKKKKAKILDKREHLNVALCTLKYEQIFKNFTKFIARTMNDFIIKQFIFNRNSLFFVIVALV